MCPVCYGLLRCNGGTISVELNAIQRGLFWEQLPKAKQKKLGKGGQRKGPHSLPASHSLRSLVSTICGWSKALLRLGECNAQRTPTKPTWKPAKINPLTKQKRREVSYPLRRKLSRSTFTGVIGLCCDV